MAKLLGKITCKAYSFGIPISVETWTNDVTEYTRVFWRLDQLTELMKNFFHQLSEISNAETSSSVMENFTLVLEIESLSKKVMATYVYIFEIYDHCEKGIPDQTVYVIAR